MTYSVKYKPVGSWRYRTIKGVTGDGLIEQTRQRWFVTEQDERIEIPIDEIIFVFSKERARLIEQQAKKRPIS